MEEEEKQEIYANKNYYCSKILISMLFDLLKVFIALDSCIEISRYNEYFDK